MNGAELIGSELVGGSADAPRLRGSRCVDCGEPCFPAATSCTRCCGSRLEPCDLGDRGRLWSWTVQMFRPKPPYDGDDGSAGFVPYGVGYVEMDCGLKIEARLRLRGRASLRIGEPMRLVLETYRHAPDGRPVQVFAFEPDAAA
jgi:uncharacterized protein